MTLTPSDSRPVVLIAEELSPATVEALGPDFEIRHCDGADRAELLAAIVDADAILVRSATKVDEEALAAAKRLKVVARAGVGLDNVDVKAATQNGVMVVNAPTSNIVSAAELAVALMLAAARHISPAHAALTRGEWKRSKYTGIELYEKTVGIVGLGRIGVLVAQRLAAFGMDVIAYDPYVQAGRAAQMGVRMVSLEELMAESDFISVHLPKTPETVGLIGADAVRHRPARPGAGQRRPRRDRRREGAVRRPQDRPDRRRRARRLRPGAVHRLAALRARERRRHAAPRRLHRRGAGEGRQSPWPGRCASRCPASWCPTRSTCRAASSPRTSGPGIPLVEKLGRIFTALAGEVAQQIDVEVRGEITEYDVKVLELAALKGVFADIVEDQVSYVNAPAARRRARHRGPAGHRPGEPRPPQPDHHPRHPRRRHRRSRSRAP